MTLTHVCIGSIPIPGAKYMEAWQSMVYCTGLENRRSRNRSVSSNLTASTNYWVYDSGSRRGLEPCSASSILATLTKIMESWVSG